MMLVNLLIHYLTFANIRSEIQTNFDNTSQGELKRLFNLQAMWNAWGERLLRFRFQLLDEIWDWKKLLDSKQLLLRMEQNCCLFSP